jgi:hypothetical protein
MVSDNDEDNSVDSRAPSETSRQEVEPKVAVDPDLLREAASLDPREKRSSSIPRGHGEGDSASRGDPLSTPIGPRGSGPTFLGVPVWGWLLLLGTALVTLLFVLDLRNRDQFLTVCSNNVVELHRGRRFPWPFGHEVVGGEEYRPITISAKADCRSQNFQSEEEAARGMLDLLLSQVRRALATPQAADLKDTRQQIQQALLLTRSFASRRKEVDWLLADLSYQEGRAGLVRAENELRLALSRFKETQKLDETRFEDLDDWILQIDEMLRTFSPSPLPKSAPNRQFSPAPSSRPMLPIAPSLPPVPDTRPPSQGGTDAGPSGTPSGILM